MTDPLVPGGRGHADVRESLGAYALGALGPDARAAVERHLVTCEACARHAAEFVAVTPLLSRVTADEAATGVLRPPPDLLDAVLERAVEEARTLRRRVVRWRAAAAAAVAFAVVVAVGPGLWRSEPDVVVADVATVSDGAGAVDGQVAAFAWEWGTTVELSARALPPRAQYVLWVVAADGTREQAGTWGATSSSRARVRGASSIQRDDVARVEVTDGAGRVIMTFDFPPDPSA